MLNYKGDNFKKTKKICLTFIFLKLWIKRHSVHTVFDWWILVDYKKYKSMSLLMRIACFSLFDPFSVAVWLFAMNDEIRKLLI